MPETKIQSLDETGMSSQDYEEMAQYEDATAYTDRWKVDFLDTEGPTGAAETTYQSDWLLWHGYYRDVPELGSIIDQKANWTVGKGYQITSGSEELKGRIRRIKGYGKDTFNTIMHNAVRTYTICGDFYAEIVRDSSGRLTNLKPLNPGSMKIVAGPFGRILRYEQVAQLGTKTMVRRFQPDEIFHLPWNRVADEIHGIPTIQKLEEVIEMIKEARKDLKTMFHRYVKPLIVISVDTDEEARISSFKRKWDEAYKKSENIIIPADTVKEIQRISIPQYSTIDPLPWLEHLKKLFIIAEGVPEIILGSGIETTEASSKIVYLAFQQMIEYNQLYLEQQIKAQLNIDIRFEFPASIEPSLLEDKSKDGKMDKPMNVNPAKHE